MLTASSAATKFPVSNLQVDLRQVRFRFTGKTSEYVQLDLGSTKTIQAIGILDHNLTTSANVILQSSEIGDFTDAFELGRWNPQGTFEIQYTSTSEARYLRVVFEDPTNAASYIQIGKLFVGPYLQMNNNFWHGWDITPVDESERDASTNLVETFNRKPIYRTLTLPFKFTTRTQRDEVKTFVEAVGIHTPFFVSLDPDNRLVEESFYARLTQLPSFKEVITDLWDFELALKESL